MACAQSRIKVRVVCARAYHALFMYNMLIRPTEQELAEFGKPDFTIFNAGPSLSTATPPTCPPPPPSTSTSGAPHLSELSCASWCMLQTLVQAANQHH